jgi:hypothetical protein
MQPIKLFFDECCSPRLPPKIKEVYSEDYPGTETKHLTEIFKAGEDDPQWLAILEQQKDWIVITADRGQDSKRPKLPLICDKLKITHISMTPALVQEGYSAHKQALLSLWPDIAKIQLLPKGTRVSLGYHMVNKGLSKIPWLSIEQKALVIWCRDNNIKLPDPN